MGTETRNLLHDFDTLDEALHAALELSRLNVGQFPEKLALAQVDDSEQTSWLGSGQSLVPLLEGRDEPRARQTV